LAADPASAKIGLVLGILAFVMVLPALWLARAAIPSWRRTPWPRWQPIPAWAASPRPKVNASA
jgi:hypothetical protein